MRQTCAPSELQVSARLITKFAGKGFSAWSHGDPEYRLKHGNDDFLVRLNSGSSWVATFVTPECLRAVMGPTNLSDPSPEHLGVPDVSMVVVRSLEIADVIAAIEHLRDDGKFERFFVPAQVSWPQVAHCPNCGHEGEVVMAERLDDTLVFVCLECFVMFDRFEDIPANPRVGDPSDEFPTLWPPASSEIQARGLDRHVIGYTG